MGTFRSINAMKSFLTTWLFATVVICVTGFVYVVPIEESHKSQGVLMLVIILTVVLQILCTAIFFSENVPNIEKDLEQNGIFRQIVVDQLNALTDNSALTESAIFTSVVRMLRMHPECIAETFTSVHSTVRQRFISHVQVLLKNECAEFDALLNNKQDYHDCIRRFEQLKRLAAAISDAEVTAKKAKSITLLARAHPH